MSDVRTLDDPLPGRCPSAMSFDGMRTQFECAGPVDHWYPWHSYEEADVKVYWLSQESTGE